MIHHQWLLVSEVELKSLRTLGGSSTLQVRCFSSSRMLPRLSSLPAYFSARLPCRPCLSACAQPAKPTSSCASRQSLRTASGTTTMEQPGEESTASHHSVSACC